MKLSNLFEELLNEKLGVPENIYESAQMLYKMIVEKMSSNPSQYFNNGTFTLIFDGNFRINDFNFKRYEISIEGKINVLGMDYDMPKLSQVNKVDFSEKNLKIEIDSEFTDKIVIIIHISIPAKDVFFKKDIGVEIGKYFIKNSTNFISILSHELKHAYDNHVIPANDYIGAVSYTVNEMIDGPQPIQKFAKAVYFTSKTESLARAPELYAALKGDNIEKRNFKKFIEEHNIFKALKTLQNYTYDVLVNDLKENAQDIKDHVFPNDPNINTPEKIVNEYLKYFYNELTDAKKTIMTGIMTTDPTKISDDESIPIEKRALFTGKKKEKYDIVMKKISIYDNNPLQYFKDTFKYIHKSCNNTMRKLSKLYDVAQPDPKTQSDILHQKITDRGENLKEYKLNFPEFDVNDIEKYKIFKYSQKSKRS